jgi:arylsulfatase A-like enzyme
MPSRIGAVVSALLNRHARGDILVGMGEAFAVLVVVDGLRADALGSYGNAQAETPFLDRLAAESIVYDFAFCLDPTLEGFYSSALPGVHPAYRYAGFNPPWRQAGVASLAQAGSHFLIADSPQIARIFGEEGIWTDTCTINAARPQSQEHNDYSGFFESAARWLSERFQAASDKPCVGWIHTSLQQLRDAFESRLQYDAVVTHLDDGIRRLFAELSLPDAGRVLFVLTAARGYALGERGRLGTDCPVLHEELVHVPLIVYTQEPGLEPARVAQLISPVDLGIRLASWLEQHAPSGHRGNASAHFHCWPPETPGEVSPDCLFFANSASDRAFRTPGWYLIQTSTSRGESRLRDNGSASQLFLKPDDRWEFNEVSSLRPETVELLASHLDRLTTQSGAGEPLRLPPLPPELLKGA